MNILGGDDAGGYISLFAWSAVTAAIIAVGHFLALADFLLNNHLRFIHGIHNSAFRQPISTGNQVKNSEADLFGGDCAMQEIIAEQESRAHGIIEHAEEPMLVVLCGPSHAGKTTFAKGLCRNFIIISSEEIRKRLSVSFRDSKHEAKVWDIYESTKCKALKEGHSVVLDACHISKRARWHALQGPNAHHRKMCVVFDLPLQTIRERCLKAKRVSLKEVERMWKDFQKNKPTVDTLKAEGFDEIYFVKESPACAAQIVCQGYSLGQSIRGEAL